MQRQCPVVSYNLNQMTTQMTGLGTAADDITSVVISYLEMDSFSTAN